MAQKITKAVIAVAGYGTRFLPATKNIPKQMLPIIDKPIIQYLVEEAVDSGITDIILVTQAGQSSMEDHFDSHVALEHVLEQTNKDKYLEKIKSIPQLANFIYVRQKKHLPYGNATPLLVVKDIIGPDESFVYMFGDDMVKSIVPCTKQLIDVFGSTKAAAVLGVQETPWEEIHKYASVKYKPETKVYEVEGLVEKADRDHAYSNMAQLGRFVFSYDVIKEVQTTRTGKDGELWIADVLNNLAQRKKVVAQPIDGKWLTTGDPLNYLKATVEHALDREDLGEEFKKYLQTIQ
jgi:UTP--glucose-1-phosphate uridylyltransferase